MRKLALFAALMLAACAPASAIDEQSEALNGPIHFMFPWLAPPSNAALTVDPKVCSAHLPPAAAIFGGALACTAEILDPTQIVLVWDWQHQDPPNLLFFDAGPPQGYRIYVSYQGQKPVLLDTQTSPDYHTLGMYDTGPQVPRCFTVRAYHGSAESPDSNPVCLQGGHPRPPTEDMPIDAMQNFNHMEQTNYDDYNLVQPQSAPYGQLVVGWQYDWRIGGLFSKDPWRWNAQRGAVRFDLSRLNGRSVMRATLKYHRVRSWRDGSDISAADQLELGTEDWTGGLPGNTLPQSDDAISLPGNGTDFSLDVTSIVRDWLSGRHVNQGFVFRHSQEGWKDDTFLDYMSWYDGITLEVTYD